MPKPERANPEQYVRQLMHFDVGGVERGRVFLVIDVVRVGGDLQAARHARGGAERA